MQLPALFSRLGTPPVSPTSGRRHPSARRAVGLLALATCLLAGSIAASASNTRSSSGTSSTRSTAAGGSSAKVQISAPARAPVGPPTLRVETGVHLGNVFTSAIDAQGRILMTAATDGTIRLWEPQSGRALAVLRMPDRGGKPVILEAAALSPDGMTVVAATTLPDDEGNGSHIHVFDRVTGQLRQTIELPEVKVADGAVGGLYRSVQEIPRERAGTPVRVGWSSPRITVLAYSPDGGHLFMGGTQRANTSEFASMVLTFRAPELGFVREYRVDKAHQSAGMSRLARVQAIAVDINGRTVIADSKNSLHLLDIAGAPMARQQISSGGVPHSLRFSPDGRYLAVSYSDQPVVQVLDGTTLASVHAHGGLREGLKSRLGERAAGARAAVGALKQVAGIAEERAIETLTAVSWSRDGSRLYAAGSLDAGKGFPLFSSSTPKGLLTAGSPLGGQVSSLQTLPDDGLLFTTASPPGWGRIDATGKVVVRSPSVVARVAPQGLRVSNDGKVVQIQLEGDASKILRYTVAERTVQEVSSLEGPGLQGAKERSPQARMVFEPGQNVFRLFERAPLSLLPDEQVLSWTLVSVGATAVVGTNHRLLAMADGTQWPRWQTYPGASVRAVALARGDQEVVAALDDGTVRWYRASDGTPILTALILADGRRFIAWHPSGRYDASPGAEDLVGWQVSYGPKVSPDFYPASRFRERYYDPAGTARVIDGQQDAAVTQGGGSGSPPGGSIATTLPPLVTILEPPPASQIKGSHAELLVAFRSASGQPITEVKVLLDGQALSASEITVGEAKSASSLAALYPDSVLRTVRVPIPGREVGLALLARNASGWGEPTVLSLVGQGAKTAGSSGPMVDAVSVAPVMSAPPSSAGGSSSSGSGVASGPADFSIEPKLYLLAVGVSRYKNPDLSLKYAAKDAQDFANAMAAQKGRLYRDVELRVLVDDKATRDGVLDGLEWLQRSTTQHDVAMLFLAGHGVNDSTGRYHFMPHDADMEAIKRTLLPDSDIQSTLSVLVGKTLMFLDTCHAGNVLGTGSRGALLADDANGFINELVAAENGVVVFTASSGSQVSQESAQWNNGAFTRALVEGLSGKADTRGSGRVTVNMIDLYVSERVKELTRGSQTPTTAKPTVVRDFPIAVVQ